MPKTIKAHFDGRVIVPDEPVDLPTGCALDVTVEPANGQGGAVDGGPSTDQAAAGDSASSEFDPDDRPLMRLVEELSKFPPNPDSPRDGAAQHDHYLYGTPKRPNP